MITITCTGDITYVSTTNESTYFYMSFKAIDPSTNEIISSTSARSIDTGYSNVDSFTLPYSVDMGKYLNGIQLCLELYADVSMSIDIEMSYSISNGTVYTLNESDLEVTTEGQQIILYNGQVFNPTVDFTLYITDFTVIFK